MRVHPDRHGQAPAAEKQQAEETLRRLNEAYRVLRDADRRRIYDQRLRPQLGPPRRPRPMLWGFRSAPPDGHDGLHLWATGATDRSPLRAVEPGRIHCLHAGDHWVDDAQLIHLEGLRLQVLEMPGSSVGDRGTRSLGRMTSLRRLSLDQCDVTDAGMADLLDLRSLEALNLRRTRVSSEAIRLLLELPALRAVWVPWHVGRRTRRALRQLRPDVVLI
ncbi:MAG: DnaJ domain-containing protein, partial [Actinomycetota bacterium]